MPNIDKVMKKLAEYGIYTREDLDEAMRNMKPLNITCMVSPVKGGLPYPKNEDKTYE